MLPSQESWAGWAALSLQDKSEGRRNDSVTFISCWGPGTGNPKLLMQANLMLDPGKSWLPEATSLSQ